jgi:hypothetical protein
MLIVIKPIETCIIPGNSVFFGIFFHNHHVQEDKIFPLQLHFDILPFYRQHHQSNQRLKTSTNSLIKGCPIAWAGVRDPCLAIFLTSFRSACIVLFPYRTPPPPESNSVSAPNSKGRGHAVIGRVSEHFHHHWLHFYQTPLVILSPCQICFSARLWQGSN